MTSTSFRPDALQGRRALITGGSRGIGGAIASRYAAMGAELVIADVDLALAESKVEELRTAGAAATAVQVDLSDRDATRVFGDAVGRVDVLVNNAAPGQSNGPFMDTPDEEWERQFAVIMWAPLLLTRTVGRGMVERGTGGSIINILSTSARSPATFVAPYAAAKAALEIITKVTALELGPSGVRANGIAPSFVPTERNRPVWDRMGFTEESGARNPMGRIAHVDDMAGVAAWLASDESAYINGQTITVDGGSSAGLFMPIRKP